jgi:hypothetical protein
MEVLGPFSRVNGDYVNIGLLEFSAENVPNICYSWGTCVYNGII